MSSGDIIVKRRPSRPQLHSEPQEEPHIVVAHHQTPHHVDPQAAEPHHHEEHHHHVVSVHRGQTHKDEHELHHHHQEKEEVVEDVDVAAAEEEVEAEAAPTRQTCKPSAVAPRHTHKEAEEAESDDEEECHEAVLAAAVAHDGHAVAPPPPQPIKTARPHDAKPKKAKKTKAAKKEAESSPATAAAKAAAAVPKKKKPTHRVNLANVEKQPPVPEGVNTPRSIAVCEKHGVNPAELAPYPKEHFQGVGVAEEVAELRYHSYEKRRQARMAQLMPAYRKAARHSASRSQEKGAGAAAATAADAEKPEEAADGEEAQRPTTQPTDEEEQMRRQFEAQHQRLLEQERRKASHGGYSNDGYRRASARPSYPRGTSPRAGAAGSLSPGRYSVSTAGAGRPTVDQPYSAVKIYSHSITEERPLTQSEAVMIDDINEREARRLDTQERAIIIQENKQLLFVERELEKQRRATANVQAKANERERRQQEHFKHSKDRYYEAYARRQRLEEERQAKLQESIAEKEGQVHANDPYASLLSRRRQSGSLTRRTSSNSNKQAAPAAAVEAGEM
jgi:hypothetical protein